MELNSRSLKCSNRQGLNRSINHDQQFQQTANRSSSKENTFYVKNDPTQKQKLNKSIDHTPDFSTALLQNVVKRPRNSSLQKQKAIPPHSQAISKKPTKKLQKIQSEQQNIEQTKILDIQQTQKSLDQDSRDQEQQYLRAIELQKMADDELIRLESQKNYEEQLLLQFESNVYFSAQQRNQILQWQRYLDCISKPHPESSPEITGFIYLYDDNNQIIDLQIDKYLDRIVYSESVIDDLFNFYLKAKSDNNQQKSLQSQQFINQIRQITNKKIDEISAFLIKNQQFFIDDKNKQLIKQKRLPISRDNLEEISTNIQRKQEERYEYEIIQQFQKDNCVQIGLSFNVIKKLGQRYRPIIFNQFNVSVDVPRVFQINPSVFRYNFINYDYLSQNSLQFILGGVHKIDCFEAFPFPVKGKGWQIQKDYNNINEVLKKIKQVEGNSMQVSEQNLSVQLQLSKDIYIGQNDQINIVQFNFQNNQWSTDKIILENFDKTNYIAKFLTPRLDYFAFSCSRMVDYCYKNWIIRSVDSNQAYLDIQTKRITLRFMISENHVTLLNDDIPQLKFLYNQKLEGSMLLYQLYKIGINLLPQQQDSTQLQFPVKQIEVENKALLELMLTVKSYTIKQSKFNLQQGSDKIIFQIRENNNYEKDVIDDQFEWKTICIWSNKCAILAAQNDQFSSELMPGTQTQAMIELILSEHQLAPPELIYRMQSLACSDFQNNIRRFIKLTGLLIYS